MRKPRDGQDTKERVLASAQKLFAMNGFSGTSLAMIAQDCGISEGLILHHFQSKKNLYRMVLDDMAGRYAKELAAIQQASHNPGEMLPSSLRSVFQFWKQDAVYERISLWAYLEKQTEFSDKEAVITAEMVHLFSQMQQSGMIAGQVHPIVYLTTMIGSIHFWNRYRDQFKQALGLTETPDELDRLFVDQFIHLMGKMMAK